MFQIKTLIVTAIIGFTLTAGDSQGSSTSTGRIANSIRIRQQDAR